MDGWIVAGTLAGIVAAIASIFAAIYGRTSVREGRTNQKLADERYLAEIEPRPRLSAVINSNTGGHQAWNFFIAEVVNGGGAATLTAVLAQKEDELYVGGATLPAHATAPMRFTYAGSAEVLGYLGISARVIAAKDVRGRWWDASSGRLIESALPTWWEGQLKKLGLPKIAITVAADGTSFAFKGPGAVAQ